MAHRAKAIEQARILIVEDEENNQIIAVKLLQLAGVLLPNIFTVDRDPAPYLQSTLKEEVDLILLDLQLPGKDGYKVLAELRQNPKLDGVPIVAMTANVMKTDIEKMRQAQFDGFIGKPINARRFSEWIERSLAGEAIWTTV